MKILIAYGSKGKFFHMKQFSDALKELGVESMLVQDSDYSTGFPSKKISELIPNNKFKNLINEFKPDCIVMAEITWYVLDKVDEFKKFKVDSISRAQLKKIRRNKVDYGHYSWTHIVKSYERGQFKEPKMKFLLKKAKAQKMRGEEHYVVSRLMLSYYELKVEERTQASRRGLSHLGKEYTAYLKLNGNPPKDLETLQVVVAKRVGLDPLTGSESQWVYIGQGPAEIRGGNRYRVIAYAPFTTGNELAYRWVVYKGGQLGVWKTKTLVAAVEKMERENLMLLKPPVAVVDKVVKNNHLNLFQTS